MGAAGFIRGRVCLRRGRCSESHTYGIGCIMRRPFRRRFSWLKVGMNETPGMCPAVLRDRQMFAACERAMAEDDAREAASLPDTHVYVHLPMTAGGTPVTEKVIELDWYDEQGVRHTGRATLWLSDSPLIAR